MGMNLNFNLRKFEGWMALLMIVLVILGIVGIILGFIITITGTSSYFEQFISIQTLVVGLLVYFVLALLVSLYVRVKSKK